MIQIAIPENSRIRAEKTSTQMKLVVIALSVPCARAAAGRIDTTNSGEAP